MFDEKEILEKIKKLSAKLADIENQASRQNRDLTAEEKTLYAEIEGNIEFLRSEIPGKPVTIGNGQVFNGGRLGHDTGYQLRGPRDGKSYNDLFGRTGGFGWDDKQTNFFAAVFSGRHHPGLLKNSGMGETVPSDGGFLVPTEHARKIHNVALESELILPRAFVQPMKSNEIEIPAMTIGDHSASLYGGFIASYTGEFGTINENNPTVRAMKLVAKKLTGLIRFSAELNLDTPGGFNQIINICGQGLAWYRDRAFLKGTGVGEPLGILNAGCTIEVDPEGEQGSDTVVYQNLVNMLGRLHPGSFNNSVWICHVTTIPQLLQLNQAVGTGGSTVPVLSESNGEWKILTRPVIFSEKTEKLGDKGDVMLCDLSQYVVGIREEMRFDQSIHVHFETDELLARLIQRHDGQPLWDAALTLEDGENTVSPFVVLGERA